MIRLTILFLFILNIVSVNAQKTWSLEDCINYAYDYNIGIVKQHINNEKLEYEMISAKGNYLPDASFSASQGFSLGNSFDISTNVGRMESSFNSFSLSSSANLFNGFSNKFKLQRAKFNIDKGKAKLDKIRFDVSLNITNYYLSVLFSQEILIVAKEQVNISYSNYNRLQNLFKNTLIAKKELLEIESILAVDQKEVIIAENNLRTNIIKLKELLGLDNNDKFEIDTIEFVDREMGSLDATKSKIITSSLTSNPLIKLSELEISIQEEIIKIAKAAFLPSVNLIYSYSSNYYHLQGTEDRVLNQATNEWVDNGFLTQLKNNKTHYISISASIPIFNRFATKVNYVKSKEDLRLFKADLENNKFQLRNIIEIAINDSESAKASLKASETAFKTQKEAFEIAQKNYTLGNIRNFEFLESKSKYIQRSSEFIKAKYDYFFKMKIVEYY
jgi:outer membrane protein